MNKLSGFVLLFAVLMFVSVSYLTYAKNTSAIYFGNGACPSGEARDYAGICFPLNECKASLFAAAGTCKNPVTGPQCNNGKCTITVTSGALNPGKEGMSPIIRWQTPCKDSAVIGCGPLKR
jgi:hypothetical protein